jgi:hypothetical protein
MQLRPAGTQSVAKQGGRGLASWAFGIQRAVGISQKCTHFRHCRVACARPLSAHTCAQQLPAHYTCEDWAQDGALLASRVCGCARQQGGVSLERAERYGAGHHPHHLQHRMQPLLRLVRHTPRPQTPQTRAFACDQALPVKTAPPHTPLTPLVLPHAGSRWVWCTARSTSARRGPSPG